ncbi:hypothetical protein DM01DRAFT_1227050 [Hesseltinella vesiculosa]|uniref:t-SNARE coiled-coil homology domain-containing protein n=1 Tax=Hesseltinella vesiculosa TaxID=101127 RepID=A0A1X2GMR8_9FUNG|nr:hypothetical protein DM01DRAFT_1227050 [Hesseltinella vesiculosa]
MDTRLISRLDVLADNTLTHVFERNRLKDLGLNYEKVDGSIQKNLTQLRKGIHQLEQQLSEEELAGASKTTHQHEDQLIQLQVKVEKLEGIYLNGGDKQQLAREALLGNSTTRSGGIRFLSSSEHVFPESLEDEQILQLQQRVMDDQDENLDHLSLAVGRQRELGLLIGEELESHIRLIDETEEMADRTDERLRRARKRLDYVGRKVKDNKSVCIVIALIFVFFILLALFR